MQTQSPPLWLRALAVVALIFGVMTLFSAGSILFGPQSASDQAGDYVPFVLLFNFAAGFAYIVAAAGIWLGRGWAFALSLLIALSTALIAVIFAGHVISGGAYEMRTVGALALRTGFWSVISLVLYRQKP